MDRQKNYKIYISSDRYRRYFRWQKVILRIENKKNQQTEKGRKKDLKNNNFADFKCTCFIVFEWFTLFWITHWITGSKSNVKNRSLTGNPIWFPLVMEVFLSPKNYPSHTLLVLWILVSQVCSLVYQPIPWKLRLIGNIDLPLFQLHL